MRSEQDRRMTAAERRHRSPQDDEGRFGDERSSESAEGREGQYEKDPWRADWRREPPHRHGEMRGGRAEGTGSGYPGRGGPGLTGRPGHRRPVGEESGPDWGRPEGRYPPGPKGYQRSDERLREDISERLMQAHYIDSSDVTVEVSGAKVVLEGTVPERPMKHAIEDLVDACPGVQDIDNRIRVRR